MPELGELTTRTIAADRRSEPEVITGPDGAALPCDSRLVDVHGGVWGRGAGTASGGVNDVALCPRFVARCRLPGRSDSAAETVSVHARSHCGVRWL